MVSSGEWKFDYHYHRVVVQWHEAERRIEQLEEALRFYAEEENWQGVWWRGAHIVSVAEQDGGTKARAVLYSEATDKENAGE